MSRVPRGLNNRINHSPGKGKETVWERVGRVELYELEGLKPKLVGLVEGAACFEDVTNYHGSHLASRRFARVGVVVSELVKRIEDPKHPLYRRMLVAPRDYDPIKNRFEGIGNSTFFGYLTWIDTQSRAL